MRLPKWLHRSERREDGYTDRRIGAAMSAATTRMAETGDRSAALEIASSWWSRGLAIADVENAGGWGDAVSAALPMIGRELCSRGECVFMIDVTPNRLIPVGDWDYPEGDWDESSWMYRIDLDGPSRSQSRTVPSAAVVHLRINVDPREPWRGRPPLELAKDAGRLAGLTDSKLADEVAMPVGGLFTIPEGASPDGEDTTDPYEELRADIGRLTGDIAFVETTASGGGEGRANAPARDWMLGRIGSNPPMPLISLHSQATDNVLSACGVSPSLATQATDGASRREGLRQFTYATLQPIAKMLLPELRAKLEQPGLNLGFDQIAAADVRARAQAYKAFTEAGIAGPEAARIVGIESGEM